MAELAGVLVGNYFLLECLAREGMVETYRARPTTRGGYDVILRLFRPEFPDPTSFREHFATEVEKVWRCYHEHIQPLLEFGTGDDLLYCATLIPEETLEQYLQHQPEGFLPLPLILRIVTQLCEALQYAHDQDIVHGNIQPSSILIHDEHVLLTHFAMKRAYQDGEPLVAQIDEGNAAYIAPEQALGMIRPASDIYALGVLLYRLLCGTVPYDDESPGEIALKHTDEPIPSLRALRPETPEELELVVRVALAKSPEARFPNPVALAQALHAAAVPDIPQVQVVPATPERRIVVQARRTRFTWSRAASFLTLSVLLLGLVGASFFVFSLPKFMHDVRGQPFWNSGQPTVSSSTPGSSPTANPSTPTALAGTPTAGSGTPIGAPNFPTKATPTSGVSFTPTTGGTVVLTPTPPPSSFLCVSGTLSIDGSQNLEPLLEQISQDYQLRCPDMSISLGADGSRIALNAVEGNQIDAAASDVTARPSRNLTDQPIAALLYAVIVNPDVEINGLSSTALSDIYQGRITNWSQVGGPDEPITIVQHPTTDTVAAIFRAFVLNGASEHIKGPRLRMTSGWAQAVAQIPGAISYVPLVAVQGVHVSVLAIDGVTPSLQSLVQGSYPFWSVQHLYTQDDGTSQFRAYLSFIHNTQETRVFSQYGAIPVSMVPQDVLASHLPGPEI